MRDLWVIAEPQTAWPRGDELTFETGAEGVGPVAFRFWVQAADDLAEPSDLSGTLVPQRDPERLADAIEKTLSQHEDTSRMAVAARELAEREFALEQTCRTMLDLFIAHRLTAAGGST